MVEVKVNWRCNVVHDWVEQVPQEAAGALYDRLRQMGCSPPWVPLAPGAERPRNRTSRARFWGGADTTLCTPDQGTRRYQSPHPRSRRSRAGSTSTSTSRRRRSTCFGPPWSAAWSCPASAHGKWWARRNSRPPGATGAGSARLEGEPRGDPAAPDHGVAQGQGHMPATGDGPEQLYNQWIRDRMEFYNQGRAARPWRCEHPAHALQLLEWPGGCLHRLVGRLF